MSAVIAELDQIPPEAFGKDVPVRQVAPENLLEVFEILYELGVGI